MTSLSLTAARRVADAMARHDDETIRNALARILRDGTGNAGADFQRVQRIKARLAHESEGNAETAPRAPLTGRALAAHEGRTVYVKARRDVPAQPNADGLLVLRYSTNEKLGRKVLKGFAKGMPIVTLTLEERATCPRSCAVWDICYGNNMMFAHRFTAGGALEDAIRQDVAALAARHPGGFMVRLHVLGDFYSAEYVHVWRQMLEMYPGLHVYGYTARLDGEIGEALDALRFIFERRFMVRRSGASGDLGAVNVERGDTQGAIVCPEQTGRAPSCAACGLCWNSRRAIAFLSH